jgi:hypothetical protein
MVTHMSTSQLVLIALASLSAVLAGSAPAAAREVPVSDLPGLRAALADARPGDVITLAAGRYDVDASLQCVTAGQASAPIVVRSASPLAAQLRVTTPEGFKVSAPFWRFEGLDVGGACADHDVCEHAFHLYGEADGTVIRGNSLHDFNAQIKSNGMPTGPGGAYPDDVVVEYNEIFDATPRDTANPVTKIDVVGGRRWVIRGNFIHDFTKAGGDNTSYAAFLKGDSREGLMERNLVYCTTAAPGSIETRVGLSLGGGGTAPEFCEDGLCTAEHEDGLLRNNVIARCSDVGIYVNKGARTRIHNNTLYQTSGIDVRFTATSADVGNNLLDGRIRTRDGATLTSGINLEEVAAVYLETAWVNPMAGDFRQLGDVSMFLDRGDPLADVPDDYCGRLRTGPYDLGAIEYDQVACDTRRPPIAAAGGAGTGGAGGA